MGRWIVRVVLLLAFFLSVAVAFFAISQLGISAPEAWVLIAADLAVLTSIFSTWSSQRVLELEEDAKQPDVYLEFDPYSRYSLLQIRVKNNGGSAAHNISIKFDRPIEKQQGGNINFGSPEGHLSILNPGESAGQAIGTSLWFFQTNENLTYTGTLQYENASKRKTFRKFIVSAEQYKASLVHDTEIVKAFRDIQDLPAILKEISNKLNR